ncbi:MAG: regulator of replication initiation timing [Aureispira sp.]|jgi:regulator of replication initiation timing
MKLLFEYLIAFGFITVIATFFFFIVQFLRLKLKKAQQKFTKENELDQIGVLKKDIGYLMAENEEIKEELRNIKYLLSKDQGKQAINLKEYEKQQIEIDQSNKFEL